MKKTIYTISSVLNDGLASNDRTATTQEEAFEQLNELKRLDKKIEKCGNFKKGETIEYFITKWSCDEDGDLEDIIDDDVYYERVIY